MKFRNTAEHDFQVPQNQILRFWEKGQSARDDFPSWARNGAPGSGRAKMTRLLAKSGPGAD